MQDQQDGVQELGPVAADMGSGVLNAEKGEKSVLDPYSNDPFGNEEFAEIKYRTMSWWQAGITMIAETIALGILSLPSVMASIGMVATIILILGLGLIATYTAYVIGQFKLAYPHIHSMADAGEVLLGRAGREIFGLAQLIFLVFIMGSHVLTFGIMLNTLSNHGTCTIAFDIVGMIVCFIFTLPRTLKKVSWLSLASFISIVSAVMITMIAIGIEHPGKAIKATVHNDFYLGFLAVTDIVFAYAGHVTFFSFMSEMKDPKEYPKTIYLLQSVDTALYLIAAVVIYRYGGQQVASPALGSLSSVMSKIAYGIAIPTIIIAGVINGHVATKYIYVRIFRGTDRLHSRGMVAWSVWVALALFLWVLAWVIAEGIPVFNDLLGLIVALFASWFTYGLSAVFWLYLNRGNWFSSTKKAFLTVVNILVFGLGLVLCALGLYVSGKAIQESSGGLSFSCNNTA